jgi:hypothetical protein
MRRCPWLRLASASGFADRRAAFGLAALAVCSVAVLAACGGGSGVGSGETPEGAALVSGATPVFVSIASDFDGEQWQAVEQLVQRFPSGPAALDDLFSSLSEDGIDFETELKPALGPEVDIAMLDLEQDEPTVVLFTRPSDPARLEALLGESDDPLFWRDIDGWYAVAEVESAIDRVLASGADALAQNEEFQQAMGAVPGDALARVYVDGPAVAKAFQEGAASSGVNLPDLAGLGSIAQLRSVALALVAQDGGVALQGVVRSSSASELSPAGSELSHVVPADALAFVSLNGLDKGLSQLLDVVGQQTPDFDQQLGQAEALLGISLEQDVLPIFAGEGAVYVRAGLPIPEVTVVLSPEDPQRAEATLEQLISAVAAFGVLGDSSSGSGSSDSSEGTEAPVPFATPITIAGIPAKHVALSDDLSLYYAVVDDRLVVTTAEKGIADLATDVPRLADDPEFQQATEAAGVPEQTLGLVYVDLKNAISLLGLTGAFDTDTLANLAPLQSLVLHAGRSEDELRFGGFLGIG